METFLLQQLSIGDKAAFEHLYFQYQPKLIFYLKGLTHNEQLSRDIAQDIFLSIWSNREKMNYIHSFNAYLFQMARNKVYDYFNRLTVSEKYIREYLEKTTESNAVSQEEKLFAHELQQQIHEAVEILPHKCKLVYCMSRELGLSNEEIASQLHISKRTVENHLSNALSILRKVLLLWILFCK